MITIKEIKTLKCVRWLRRTPLFLLRTRKKFAKDINDSIDHCVGRKITSRERNKLQCKMAKAWAKDYYWFDEFYFFHYELLSRNGKKAFATERRKREFCDKVNPKEFQKVFDDKLQTYKLFSPYYKRDVISLGSGEKAFEDFVQKHPRFIVKPVDSSLGFGVKIFEVNSENSATSLYEKLNKEYSRGGGVIEEIISQGMETALFHPMSLNTVRVPTFRFENEVQILPCFFRIGRGDSVVDNAGAGGIIAWLDIETGVVLAAADETGKKFFFHPDTQMQIIGYKLPQWDAAKDLAKQLALVVPSNRYTSWDLAWSESGWVMVEGNARGQFVWQIPSQEGFNPELTKIEKRYEEETK